MVATRGYKSNAWRPRASQLGAALIVVLVVAGVISTVALIAAYSARTELRIAQNQYRGLQALYSAEAGLSHAYRLVATNPSSINTILAAGGAGGIMATNVGAVTAIGGVNYNFRNFAGPGVDGYYVRLEDNVDENPNDAAGDTDGQVRIISRGRAGEAERVLEGIVANTPGYCIFGATSVAGEKGIELSGGALIDSYSSAGGYPATAGSAAQLGANAVFNASGGALVKGDVSAVQSIDLSAASITGTQNIGVPSEAFASIPPCGPTWSSTTGISGTYTYASGVLEADGGAGGAITLAAGTYCFNDLKLTNGATLTVSGGPVGVTLDHELNLSGGAVANTTGIPTNLRFFSSASGSTLVYLSGGASAAMTVYAPDTKVDISGAASIFGSVIGNIVVFNGGAGIHCEMDSLIASDGGVGGVQLVGWHEIR